MHGMNGMYVCMLCVSMYSILWNVCMYDIDAMHRMYAWNACMYCIYGLVCMHGMYVCMVCKIYMICIVCMYGMYVSYVHVFFVCR